MPQPGNSKQDPGKHDNLTTPLKTDAASKTDKAGTDKAGTDKAATDRAIADQTTVLAPSESGKRDPKETTTRVISKNRPSPTGDAAVKSPSDLPDNVAVTTDKQAKRPGKTLTGSGKNVGLVAASNSPKTGKTKTANIDAAKDKNAPAGQSVAANKDDKETRDAGDTVKSNDVAVSETTGSVWVFFVS